MNTGISGQEHLLLLNLFRNCAQRFIEKIYLHGSNEKEVELNPEDIADVQIINSPSSDLRMRIVFADTDNVKYLRRKCKSVITDSEWYHIYCRRKGDLHDENDVIRYILFPLFLEDKAAAAGPIQSLLFFMAENYLNIHATTYDELELQLVLLGKYEKA